jgi:hypothetical protein
VSTKLIPVSFASANSLAISAAAFSAAALASASALAFASVAAFASAAALQNPPQVSHIVRSLTVYFWELKLAFSKV